VRGLRRAVLSQAKRPQGTARTEEAPVSFVCAQASLARSAPGQAPAHWHGLECRRHHGEARAPRRRGLRVRSGASRRQMWLTAANSSRVLAIWLAETPGGRCQAPRAMHTGLGCPAAVGSVLGSTTGSQARLRRGEGQAEPRRVPRDRGPSRGPAFDSLENRETERSRLFPGATRKFRMLAWRVPSGFREHMTR